MDTAEGRGVVDCFLVLPYMWQMICTIYPFHFFVSEWYLILAMFFSALAPIYLFSHVLSFARGIVGGLLMESLPSYLLNTHFVFSG